MSTITTPTRQLEKELAQAMRELAAANALLREAHESLIRTASHVPPNSVSKADFLRGKPIEQCWTKDSANAVINRIAAHLEENK